MRHQPRRTSALAPCALAAALAAATSLGGCSEDFAPYSRLDKLRVLALRAEPVNPPLGVATTVEPLVYSPDPTPVTFAWSWCPLAGAADSATACPITDAQVQQIGTTLGTSEPLPALALGTAPTQDWKNVLPPAALAALCTNGLMVNQGGVPLALKLDCEGGFPIRVTVVASQAGASIAATTVLRLPTAEGTTSNANPVVSGLTVVRDAGEMSFASDPPVVLPRLQKTNVKVSVADTESETYLGQADDGSPATVRERLNLSWFVETGDMDNDRTSFLDGANTIADATKNKWKPAKVIDYPQGTAKMIVVIRDNRGGVGWTSGVVALEAQP